MFDDPIVWYLFLGGSGAGALSVLAGLDLARGHIARKGSGPLSPWVHALDRGFFVRGLVAGCAALALGALCLLIDLEHPERFYYVLVHPTTSLLTFGSYVLAATLLCGGALCGIALFNLMRVPTGAVKTLESSTIILGMCTMAYTGTFLTGISFVPTWNNPVLPLLFTCSSFSAGTACALGCAAAGEDRSRTPLVHALMRADTFAVALEAVSLGAYLAWAALATGNPEPAAELLTGGGSWLFWTGFVVSGLILPLVFGIAYNRRGSAALPAAVVACAIVGGFALRYCIVNAPLG